MEELKSTSRKPNPTEKRLITRDYFKYYNAVAVAGIYQFTQQEQSKNLSRQEFYFSALKTCIDKQPMLSAIVEDATLSNERLTQVQTINLHNHVNILQKLPDSAHHTEDEQIARTMEHIHNDARLAIFNRSKHNPAWRIDVLVLDASRKRVLISFTYSHCIGDGMSGPIFHKSFLAALNAGNAPVDASFEVRRAALPNLPHLPVSLSFLLAPALGHYLPRFISSLLGFKASVSGSDETTWLGASHFDDRLSPDRPITTAVEICRLDGKTLSSVLKASSNRQSKLTALLSGLIALCMSRRLPNYSASFPQKTNIICCIPTNIRAPADIPSDMIGNFASATYTRHLITKTRELIINDEVWQRARIQGAEIAKSVVSLQNQAIGLLAWISNMKTWMEDQLGHQSDASFQLSNLMAFDGGRESIVVEKMYFCQPADVVGQIINFNTMSVKGGDLVICAVWQPGALGLDEPDGSSVEENDRNFVVEILQDLKKCLVLVAESAENAEEES